MKLLLDTHTFLWFIMGDTHLSAKANMLLEDESNDAILSMASLWEMGIKVCIGKLILPGSFAAYIPEQLRINEIELLNVKFDHVAVVSQLPLHHRDPFDRILIAQAMVEKIALISADPLLDAYAVNRLW